MAVEAQECPKCGAAIRFNQGQDEVICAYCGTPVARSAATPPIEKEVEAEKLVQEMVERERRLHSQGRLTMAKILTAQSTGIFRNTVEGRGVLMSFTVEVQPDDEAPFNAEPKTLVGLVAVDRYCPGTVLDVRYDPQDHAQVSIEGRHGVPESNPEELERQREAQALAAAYLSGENDGSVAAWMRLQEAQAQSAGTAVETPSPAWGKPEAAGSRGVFESIDQFSRCYGKEIGVNQTRWRYYALGSGSPVLWLTGGLRRAALGFAFMECLAARHRVIAPDYPPVQTIAEYLSAFDAILKMEGVNTFIVVGQSYGGMLAQACVAHRPQDVQRLILSSSGPASYGSGWLPAEYIMIGLARLLPETWVKGMLARGLLKVMTLPEDQRGEWVEAVQTLMQREITRADVVSHFAVAADLIRSRLITPAAFQNWHGDIFVLRAANDITQSEKDFPIYERIYGRPAKVIEMGSMGHTAALFDPARYIELLEGALI